MSDFLQTRALVSSARSNITKLRELWRRHLDSCTFTLSIEPSSGRAHHYANYDPSVPIDLAITSKHILSDLRSALDYAVFASARAAGTAASGGRNVAFPFGRDADDVSCQFLRKYSGVPEYLRDHILNMRPYVGGDAQLTRLNNLRNRKDHRALLGLISHAVGVRFNPSHNMNLFTPSPCGEPVEDRFLLGTSPLAGDVRLDVSLILELLFTAEGISPAIEALPTLSAIADRVEEVVRSIETLAKEHAGI